MSYTNEEREDDEQSDRDATQERIANALEQLVEMLRDQQRVRDGMRFISDLLKSINERKTEP